MLPYIRLGAQLWESLLDNRGILRTAFKDEEFDFMEYQLQRWQKALPEHLRPEHVAVSLQRTEPHEFSNGTIFATRVLLYLRANQIRILVQRPILYSNQATSTHRRRVESLIAVARDSIEKLIQVDEISDIYRKQQPFHNHFLNSALAALFLVIAHQSHNTAYNAPAESGPHSSAAVRESIFKALDLIRSYSATSRSCGRLLRRFEGPRGLLIRLGLLRRNDQPATESQPTASPVIANPYAPKRTSGNVDGANLTDFTIRGHTQPPLPITSLIDVPGSDSSMADFFSNDIVLTNHSDAFFTDPMSQSGNFGNELNFLFDNFL